MTRVKPWFAVYQRVTYVLRKKTTFLASRSRILIRDIILTEAPCLRRQPFESGRPDYTLFFSSVHKPYVRRVSVRWFVRFMVHLYSITINGFVFVFYRLLSGMYLSTVIISKGFSSSRMDSVNVIERLVELLPFIAEPRRLWLPGSEDSRR